MDRKFTLPFALALVAAALVGCSTNKLKVEEPKPNPLPKLAQVKHWFPFFHKAFLQQTKPIHYVYSLTLIMV